MKILSVSVIILTMALLSSCGKVDEGTPAGVKELAPVGSTNQPDGVVVRARAMMEVNTGTPQSSLMSFLLPQALAASAGIVPITVINSPSSSMTMDNTQFVIPTITNAVLSFGSLKVTALS